MRDYLIITTLLFVLATPFALAKTKPVQWGNLPTDVLRVMDHSQRCNELTADAAFGNLFGHQMGFWTKTKKQLQCAQVLGDIKKLRKRYTEPSVQAALDWAENMAKPR